MPYTINGFGTGYWGKTNRLVQTGVCEFCGKQGDLETYDTSTYFTAVFFPVFPLGKKRIIQECPSCKRHRAMPLKKWKALVEETMATCMKDSVEKGLAAGMKDLLSAVMGLQAASKFEQVLEASENQTWTTSEPYEYLSDACCHFNHVDKALMFSRKAFDLNPSPENRIRLINTAALTGEVETIVQLLDQNLTQTLPDPDVFLVGIEGLLVLGKVEEARSYLHKIQNYDFPAEIKPHFDSLLRTAEKPSGRAHRKLQKAYHVPPPVNPGKSFSVHLARWAFPLVVLVFVALVYGPILTTTATIDVALVNGLNVPYQVTLNGETYKLYAQSARKIPVETKVLEWAPVQGDKAPFIEPGRMEIQLKLSKKSNSGNIVVINPDRTAFIQRSRLQYRTEETLNRVADPEFEVVSGKVSYSYENIDYPFKEFPEEIDLGSRDFKWLTGLEVLKDINVGEATSWLFEEKGEEEAQGWLRAQIQVLPDNYTHLGLAWQLLGTEEFTKLICLHLERIPLLVEVHRISQTVRQNDLEDTTLQSDYLALTHAHPNDGDAYYLYGRILDDEKKAASVFLKSTSEVTSPSAYGYYALAYAAFNQGLTHDAFTLLEEARKLRPDAESFDDLWWYTNWVLKNVPEILTHVDEVKKNDLYSYQANLDSIVAHAYFGKPQYAEIRLESYEKRLMASDSGITANAARDLLRLVNVQMAYAQEGFDPEAYPLNTEEPGYVDFILQASRGNLDFCEEYVAGLETPVAPTFPLVLTLLASEQGEKEKQMNYERSWLEALVITESERQRIAGWLNAPVAPKVEEVIQINIHPASKHMLVAVLRHHFPELKPELKDLQEALNFSPYFPFRMLENEEGE